MKPSLIKVAQLVTQEDRRKIRIAKLKEITKAGDDLFFILAGEEVFKKSLKFDNYSSFEKGMRQLIEKARHRHRTEGPTTVPPPGDLLNQLKELLSVDYTPPQAGEDMGGDLIALANYYRSNFFVPSIEMILDLSLCKLIGAVNKLCAIAIQKGERELTRTKKSTKAKKEETDKRKGIVIAIYEHGQEIASGTKFSIVYQVIKDQFKYHQENPNKDCYLGVIPKDMKPPHRDTLKRWFSKEGILKSGFYKRGAP